MKQKKIISHLKGDVKGYKKEIKEDEELIKEIKRTKKISKKGKKTT